MQISLEQVIDIYNELIDGKHGHIFYLYADDIKFKYPTSIFDDIDLINKRTAEELYSVCYIFSEKHNVSIKINNIDLNQWISKVRSGELEFEGKLEIKTKKNKDDNMIKDGKLLVIERFDVRRQTFGVPATEWTPEDLMSKSFDLMRFSEIAMGIDENLNTVILKNRWGKSGIVVSREEYKDYLRLKEKEKHENDKANNTSEKKSFMGRILDRIKVFPFN